MASSDFDAVPGFNIWDALGITVPVHEAGKPKAIGITAAEVAKAYKIASKHCHPDKLCNRAPGTRDAFPSMVQVNVARDFILDDSKTKIDEYAYWRAVQRYPNQTRPFHPHFPIGDIRVFDLSKYPNIASSSAASAETPPQADADSDVEEIPKGHFTPSAKSSRRSSQMDSDAFPTESYADSDIDEDYTDNTAQSKSTRRGAGHTRKPRHAPYAENADRTNKPSTGRNKKRSSGRAKKPAAHNEMPSDDDEPMSNSSNGGPNTIDASCDVASIADPPMSTTIFIGWPVDEYTKAGLNKDNIPIVVAYFTKYGNLRTRIVGWNQNGDHIPHHKGLLIDPSEIVPNSYFSRFKTLGQIQDEVIRLMHISEAGRGGLMRGLYYQRQASM